MLSVHSASFDCAKAKTKIDKLICSDARLSGADEKLNALYKEVLAKSPVAEDTRQQQLEWVKQSRNTCKDADCLQQAYTSRISDLQEQLEKLPFKPVLDKPLIVLPSSPAEDRDAAAKIGPAIVKKEPLELIGRVSEGHDVAGANFGISSGKRYYVIRYAWDLTDEQKETLNKIEDPNQYVLLKAQLVTYKDESKAIDPDSEVQIFAQLP
jgi:Lysozyme inhibitor LprI